MHSKYADTEYALNHMLDFTGFNYQNIILKYNI